eukprot:5914045-Heterocapsa_arctica.AAC.1
MYVLFFPKGSLSCVRAYSPPRGPSRCWAGGCLPSVPAIGSPTQAQQQLGQGGRAEGGAGERPGSQSLSGAARAAGAGSAGSAGREGRA